MTTIDSGSQRDSPVFDEMSESETDITNTRKNNFLKQQFMKHNNNNFSITKNCNDHHVPNEKMRGRKTFAFWTLVCLLLFLALGNLLLTLTILGVLRLGHGMSSLELVPEASAIKFFGNTDLGHVYKVDGKINGFDNLPVQINSDENGSLLLNLVGKGGRPINKLTMNRNGTRFHNMASFIVGEPSNHPSFSTNSPYYTLLNGADRLQTKMTHANRIISLYNKSLDMKADTILNLKGNEGTRMESRQTVWSADQDIYLESVNGSIIFNGKDGVSIDMKNIPIVQNENIRSLSTQFKLCVCIPHGKLFRIPVSQGQITRVSCNHIKMTSSHNPCM